MANDPKADALKLLQADYFTVLSLPRTAKSEEVPKAYIAAAKVYHPDRAPNEELRVLFTKVFTRLDLAKVTLADPARREKYLAELTNPGRAGGNAAEANVAFKMAEAMLKKNSAAEAERHLRRAVHLAPSNVEYAALLVWVQVKPETANGPLTELCKELDALLGREPDSERALFYRGQIRKRLGRDAAAAADFARAAELNPQNLDAVREVRIHNMRKAEKAKEGKESSGGVGGFFRRILKRD